MKKNAWLARLLTLSLSLSPLYAQEQPPAPAQVDPARLAAAGALTLRPDAAPGSYVLQVVVNDAPPGKKRQIATQWLDFEVVRQ